MSFPKKGKSFPKKGKSFPKRDGNSGSDFSLDDRAFAMKIARALKAELKDRNSRAKLVAGWTGANERTVKNWISGKYAPCGRHLVVLAQAFGPGAKSPFCRWRIGRSCFCPQKWDIGGGRRWSWQRALMRAARRRFGWLTPGPGLTDLVDQEARSRVYASKHAVLLLKIK